MTQAFEATSPAVDAGNAGSSPGYDSFTLESWGWSSRPGECAPKAAALASLVNLAPPDPVASVTYQSKGNVLVIAGDDAARARRVAAALAKRLHVTVLARERTQPTEWGGRIVSLEGYLGEFTAVIDGLDTGAGAVAGSSQPTKFDLVLDFGSAPAFAMRQPPQGYFRAPATDEALAPILEDLGGAVGEFEKPRYFAYRENICAHSRSGIEGCNACIEICSTRAIEPDGDHVKVDPHLCMGCGACATVCPSGAMGYQYPRVADRGAQLKQLLSTYRHAGGEDPCIVFHNGHDGRDLLATAAASGAGLPGRAMPIETWHVAAVGLDLLLPAIAFGARQVVVLAAGSEDREYVAALEAQMAIGQAIVSALGYSGRHFALVQAATPEALARGLTDLGSAQGVSTAGTFLLSNDKRTAIEFAVEHLAKHAPSRVDEIALPAGAPFGEIVVDKSKCTMCLACVGACPESALMDGVDQPMLKFLERNCVQCGLCEATCPEEAISLSSRLLLTPAVREARVLNETQPFNCVRCAKPFGTRQMVEAMMGRLTGHSMFAQSDALKRLQMCADCRIVDMMSTKNEVSVLRMGADS
jgi:ferredoxin